MKPPLQNLFLIHQFYTNPIESFFPSHPPKKVN